MIAVIPEDFETYEFIMKLFREENPWINTGHECYNVPQIRLMCERVADFSARRAREKAIEECQIYLNDLSNNAQKEHDSDTSFCYLTAFIALEKLKSTTN